MSILAARFREETKKSKNPSMGREMEPDVSYSTGYLAFDFLNGSIVHVKSETQDFKYYSVGITDGSLVMFIGRSGCGKSTLMVQIATNIIRQFKTSCFFFESVEVGMEETRLLALSRLSREDYKQKIIARNTGVTQETVYERVKLVHDLKVNNRDDFEYDTGLYNSFGERIFKLEPTVFGLDSLALLVKQEMTEEDELSGQMSVTAATKGNSRLYKMITPMLKAANIIFMSINHITDDVSLRPKKPQLAFLKLGEYLAGGKAAHYVQSTIIRLDDHNKLTEDKDFGIYGNLVDLTLVKSRSNGNGHSCTIVFDENIGFDPELSLYYLLKQNNKVHGAGRSFYIEGAEDIKFSQKQFKEKLCEKPELQEAFKAKVLEILIDSMKIREEKIFKEQQLNLSSQILNSIYDTTA